ncbi:MAG: hypothetical protein B7X46_00650 [Thiomonas sp. 15-66-11]|nr:MAG: hypothetical protein B7X46_00650 [Thiomonas sp. 15-66-11]
MTKPAASALSQPRGRPATGLLRNRGLSPAGGLRERFARWAQQRHDPGAQTLLSHRNVYILPTRAGWFFALTLLVLLVAAINYQLNLGYLLTFLLAGSALASLHVTHNNVRGLALAARLSDDAVFYAGQPAALRLQLHSPGRQRWGLLAAPDGQGFHAVDVDRDATLDFALPWTPRARGHQPWPRLVVESRYPLGLWRAWSVWRPGASIWVYPAPETPAPALPAQRHVRSEGQNIARLTPGDELDDLRTYRRGDPLRHVVWKKTNADDLIVRTATPATALPERWLDWNDLPATQALEARLSRLCAWVLAAQRNPQPFGLRLPGHEIAPGSGAAHTRRCLRVLATYGQASGQPSASS